MSIDLAAIRARAEAKGAALHYYAHKDVPALLALVDAQAARIDKAREAVAGHGGENGAASGCPSCRVARALTEDVAQ